MKILGSVAAAATLSLLAAPIAAQTFVARTSATGILPRGAVGPDGRTAVAWTESTQVQATVFGPSGALLHTLRLQTAAGSSVRATGLGFAPSGDLIVVGDVDNAPWIGAYDPATGALVWDHTAADQGGLFAVTVLADGHLLACGSLSIPGVNRTLAVLLTPTGDVVWQRLYSDLQGHDWGYDVEPASDGGAWLVGGMQGGLRVTRIDAGLAWTVWQKEYAIADGLFEARIRATPDGGLIVAGITEPVEDFYRVGAMKLSASGTVEWARGYASFDASIWDAGILRIGDVETTPEGYAIAVGQIVAAPAVGRDVALLHLDPFGAPIAYRNVGVPGHHEDALALERAADGSLLCPSWVEGQGPRVMRVAASATSGLSCPPEAPLPVWPYALSVTSKTTIWGFSSSAPAQTEKHAAGLVSSLVAWIECEGACAVTAIPFGAGLAGSGGKVPQIQGTDGPCAGGGPAIHVANGLGGTIGVLGVSFDTAALPVLGGWIWLHPSGLFTVPLALGGAPGVAGAGGTTLPIAADLTPLLGTQIHAQAVLLDPGAAQGIAMTGGLTLDVH